jgi:hypothetical protein
MLAFHLTLAVVGIAFAGCGIREAISRFRGARHASFRNPDRRKI